VRPAAEHFALAAQAFFIAIPAVAMRQQAIRVNHRIRCAQFYAESKQIRRRLPSAFTAEPAQPVPSITAKKDLIDIPEVRRRLIQ
jgi:hypothetical protein